MKFRVWDKKKKKYLDSECEAYVSREGILYISDDISCSHGQYLLSPEDSEGFSLEFSTDMLDKNDKEIYEGDVVKVDTSFDEDIEDDSSIVFVYNITRFVSDYFYRYDSLDLEIIGNVNENPEYLDDVESKDE